VKTVKDIIELIDKNKSSENSPSLRQHATHVADARDAGSTTKIGLRDVPADTPIQRQKHRYVSDKCEAYVFRYDMGGRIGAVPFNEAMAITGCVNFRNGNHGPELYIRGTPEDVEDHDPNTIFVIVGDHKCENGVMEKAVFTWHPGCPLPPLEDGITEDTGVKVDFD